MKKNQPKAISAELRAEAKQKIPQELLPKLAEFVHNSWWQEKIKLGFHHPSELHKEWDPKAPKKICDHCHLDMIPFDELTPATKNLDNATVETVLAGLVLQGYKIIADKKKTTSE
nr:RyR domain-containing protein [Candidatus Sigynarchaeota archaeon]